MTSFPSTCITISPSPGVEESGKGEEPAEGGGVDMAVGAAQDRGDTDSDEEYVTTNFATE